MTIEELRKVAVKEWDGYLTISPAVARKISVTGKLPKIGYAVKSSVMWPHELCTIQGGGRIFQEERDMWIGWTTYQGKQKLYIY